MSQQLWLWRLSLLFLSVKVKIMMMLSVLSLCYSAISVLGGSWGVQKRGRDFLWLWTHYSFCWCLFDGFRSFVWILIHNAVFSISFLIAFVHYHKAANSASGGKVTVETSAVFWLQEKQFWSTAYRGCLWYPQVTDVFCVSSITALWMHNNFRICAQQFWFFYHFAAFSWSVCNIFHRNMSCDSLLILRLWKWL